MWLYFNCTFKSSKVGYRVSAYDLENNILIDLGDGKKNTICMPHMCNSIFNHQVGRTMLLSTDENGKLMFSVLGLMQNNYEKNINVIFCNESPALIYKTFLFFCLNYKEANELIANALVKKDDCSLGYEIADYTLLEDLYHRIVRMECNIDWKNFPQKQLIAFISEEQFEDYYLNIGEIYQNANVEKYQIGDSKAVPLAFIEHINDALGKKDGSIKIKGWFVLVILILGFIVIASVSAFKVKGATIEKRNLLPENEVNCEDSTMDDEIGRIEET